MKIWSIFRTRKSRKWGFYLGAIPRVTAQPGNWLKAAELKPTTTSTTSLTAASTTTTTKMSSPEVEKKSSFEQVLWLSDAEKERKFFDESLLLLLLPLFLLLLLLLMLLLLFLSLLASRLFDQCIFFQFTDVLRCDALHRLFNIQQKNPHLSRRRSHHWQKQNQVEIKKQSRIKVDLLGLLFKKVIKNRAGLGLTRALWRTSIESFRKPLKLRGFSDRVD